MQESKLARFYELDQEIKKLTKERDSLKKELKEGLEHGTHIVGNFVADFAERTRIGVDLKKIYEDFGKEKMKDYETISGYSIFTVKKGMR